MGATSYPSAVKKLPSKWVVCIQQYVNNSTKRKVLIVTNFCMSYHTTMYYSISCSKYYTGRHTQRWWLFRYQDWGDWYNLSHMIVWRRLRDTMNNLSHKYASITEGTMCMCSCTLCSTELHRFCFLTTHIENELIMAALHSRCGHYIFVLWFILSSFFISSPNLSCRRLDVYHTSAHGVALVWI